MNGIRCYIRKRSKNKRTLVHPRMRHREQFGRHYEIAAQLNIDIYSPRPAVNIPYPPHSTFDAETEMRRLDDAISTLRNHIDQLTSNLDTRIVNLQSEWRQHLAETADLLDKFDHISKRQQKRRSREKAAEGGPGVDPEADPEPTTDPVTMRVQARRRGNAIRS